MLFTVPCAHALVLLVRHVMMMHTVCNVYYAFMLDRKKIFNITNKKQ